MTSTNDERLREGRRLYERYARPLEGDHTGRFVAIAPDGRLVIGSTMLETAQRAKSTIGPGVYLLKIGTRTVGKWR